MDIGPFNAKLEQCLSFYPRNEKPEFGLMVDCGNIPAFEPIGKLLEWNWLPETTKTNPPKKILKNVTITNYDQDHFTQAIKHLIISAIRNN